MKHRSHFYRTKRQVIDLESGIYYDSLSDACKARNLPYNTVYARMSGATKTNKTTLRYL
jgi:hypothetical protein